MGCSISCSVFKSFSTVLQWAFQERVESDKVTHYLGNFLFAGPGGSSNEFAQLMTNLKELAH